jgi:photosystem II stability/assembly factor-like uncharacterized protein
MNPQPVCPVVAPISSRRRRRIASAALALLLASTLVAPAAAHAPHDEVWKVEISPNYPADQTIFATFLLSNTEVFSRSTDGGRSWETVGQPFIADGLKSFAFSPNYAVDGRCYAATTRGGVYITGDNGDTWRQTNSGLLDLKVRRLALSPTFATDRTMLAATPSGCFRSTDAGATWSYSSTGMAIVDSEVVSFAPDDPNVAFIGSNDLYRSDDGGQTWTLLTTFAASMESLSVSYGFTTDSTLAASFGAAGLGVLTSADGGASFAPMTTGMSDLKINVVEFADDGTMFAASWADGVYRAPSVGSSWTTILDGFADLTTLTANHFVDISVSPNFTTDQTVVAGMFEGMHVSTDGGFSYDRKDIYPLRVIHGMQFSPDWANDGTIFVGSYGSGVLKYVADPVPMGTGGAGTCSLSRLESGTWEARNLGINRIWSSELRISPGFAADQQLFYAYTVGYNTTDAAKTWNAMSMPAGVYLVREFGLSPDYPTDPTIFLGAEVHQGFHRSTDGGRTWTSLTAGLPPTISARYIQLSPTYAIDRTVFIGHQGPSVGSDGISKSTDGGNNWIQVNNGLPSLEIPRAVQISPAYIDDQTVFAGFSREGMFKTNDGGANWQQINVGMPPTPITIEQISVSPDYQVDRTVFCATQSYGVFRSTNGGGNWTPVNNGLEITAPWVMEISPDFKNDDTLLLATMDFIWFTEDRGDNWKPMPGYLRLDDWHTIVDYEGTWNRVAEAGSMEQFYASSTNPGDAFEVEVYADSLRFIAVRDAASGIAEIFVDGVSAGQFDLYSPTTLPEQVIHEVYWDEVDYHTMRVEMTGTKNPASSGIEVKTDGFDYSFGTELPYQRYGPSTAGTGGVTPTISATDCPANGATFNLDLAGGLGGASGLLALGTSPGAQPLPGGVFLVGNLATLISFSASGTPGASGAGGLTLPLSVPAGPALVGLSFYAQGGFVDPAAAGGVSLTRGLQVRIQ